MYVIWMSIIDYNLFFIVEQNNGHYTHDMHKMGRENKREAKEKENNVV